MVAMFNVSVIALSNNKITQQLYKMFKQYIPDELKDEEAYQYDEKRYEIHFPIPKDSNAFLQLQSIAKENNISVRTYELTKHTTKEIQNALFFQMFISDPLESEGTYARDYGTKYADYCDACKIGGTLVGDVLVDRKLVKKAGIATLRPDIFVSKEVRWLIESNNLTGVRFDHKVRDYKGREIPEYYVMSFDHIMPPMDSKTWFSFDPPAHFCSKCKKTIPYLRSNCYYKQTDFNDAKDFNLSNEVYDNFAERAIIISKKAKSVFEHAKVRCGFHMLNVLP